MTTDSAMQCNRHPTSKDRAFPVTFQHFQIPLTRSSKLRNEELPNVGYFYYCVSRRNKHGLAACFYEDESF